MISKFIFAIKHFSILLSFLIGLAVSSVAQAGSACFDIMTIFGADGVELVSEKLQEQEFRYIQLIAQKRSLLERLALQGNVDHHRDPDFPAQMAFLAKLEALSPVINNFIENQQLISEATHSSEADAIELAELATLENEELEEAIEQEIASLQQMIWDLSVPNVQRAVIIEITPAEDKPESTLAVGTLKSFYEKLSSQLGWSVEVLDAKEDNTYSSVLTKGSERLNHAYLKISGTEVYRKLFLEGGVHRFIFQDNHYIGSSNRALKSSKTHTNYAKVSVYPMPKKNTFKFNENEIDLEFTKGSGAGGQHRNKVSSAVRATHTPTGISVFVQQERDQHVNRRVALQMLQAKLFTRFLEQENIRLKKVRESGAIKENFSNSPYLRTYNFQDNQIESEDILSGRKEPKSFNQWQDYLQIRLSTFNDALIGEIQDLERALIEQY